MPRRLRGALRWLAMALGLAAVAFAGSALIPGSHASRAPRFSLRVTARSTSPANQLPEHLNRVLGATSSARLYGRADALRENQGVDLNGQLTSDLTPVAARQFRQPILRFRRYAERLATRFTAATAVLRTSLSAGNRAQARQAWNAAYFDFMRLGADYNLLPAGLTNRIAAVPASAGDTRFPGLHRIERGLWTEEPLRRLLPVASALIAAARALQRRLPHVPIGILAYTLRIHEILEDAQRDLLSGSDVPWSGAGVLGTEAGVMATRELLATVKPILEGRDNAYGQSENWLDQLQATLLSIRHAHRGWPSIRQLTMLQRERINAAMAGTLSALEQVPGALETKTIDGFPAIAGRRAAKR
jgi:high-affinity iron transporter